MLLSHPTPPPAAGDDAMLSVAASVSEEGTQLPGRYSPTPPHPPASGDDAMLTVAASVTRMLVSESRGWWLRNRLFWFRNHLFLVAESSCFGCGIVFFGCGSVSDFGCGIAEIWLRKRGNMVSESEFIQSRTHNSITDNSFTRNSLTQLSHTHTTYSHTQLRHTHTQWQAWHLVTSSVLWRGRLGTRRHGRGILRGKRGTYGAGLALVVGLVPVCRRGRRGCLRGKRGTWRYRLSFCVAGVALGDICGRRGTYGTGLALVVRLVSVCRRGCRGCLRGRRVAFGSIDLHSVWLAWRHRASLCVAGVALMALSWLWWRAWFPFVAVDAAAVCVADMSFGSFDLHSVWQVGTWRHRPALCVASVALGDTKCHFLRGRHCKC